MKRNLKVCMVILFGIFWFRIVNAEAAPVTLDIDPVSVEIGTFYNGTIVKVSGQVPAAAEVVVRMSGEGEELHLKRKGKVAGLLWMNTSDLTFHNAPKVYKVYTGSGLNDLDSTAARDLGFAALKNRIEISPDSTDNDFLLGEFVRLKTKESLYSVILDGVSYGPEENGMKSYEATIDIPPSMKEGVYSVDMAAVQNGNIVTTSTLPLPLKQIGFPEQISKMAYGHALWYGIMSVVIAVMAGLIMGLLFKGKGGAH